MYGWDTLVLLRHLLDAGLSKTAIAARLGVSRRVIYHWLATGQLDRQLSESPPPRRTLGDPYKPLILERLTTYPALSARHLANLCSFGARSSRASSSSRPLRAARIRDASGSSGIGRAHPRVRLTG